MTPIEVAQLHDGKSLADALAKPGEVLYTWYLSTKDPEVRAGLARLRALREERSKAVDGLREIMVMRRSPRPRENFLLKRGAYDDPGERVSPGTPTALPAFAKDLPRNRLGLARWLTATDNPLTARIAVNRLWQMLFGRGLVRTPEDFGSQGRPPTHPDLLDWLAKDFMLHGWDVKRTIKTMVTSATYRQSSRGASGRDPENVWLARAPRHRLPAEMIRDNALAASGLLVEKVGGPPVRPYEVAVSFKPVKRDKGEGLYRRSLYTYWKRTGPAPVMMALDASKRDGCRVKRERTASPIQAFILMNDPQFVEAARVLGQRLARKHGDDVKALLTEMFRILTSRRPTEAERRLLLKLYRDERAAFEREPGRAKAFLKNGDAPADAKVPAPQAAAAGVVASMLLNFDECVMKR